MSRVPDGEILVDITRDTPDGLRREEWSFRMSGAVHSYAKAERDRASDEWTYTLCTFPDFPRIFGNLWKDPPQDVIDEALAKCAVHAPYLEARAAALHVLHTALDLPAGGLDAEADILSAIGGRLLGLMATYPRSSLGSGAQNGRAAAVVLRELADILINGGVA